MKYDVSKKEIILDRELSNLDKFVVKFCSLLKDYVIVSGYVSILLGRTRGTEDVDLLIPEINFAEFTNIWNEVYNNGFECLNTSKIIEAFNMLKEHAIRFAKPGKPVPNMEFKVIKTDLDKYSFENRLKVILNEGKLYISPIELQIPFKLFLAADGDYKEVSSDKDIEDARHLYRLFKGKINKDEMLLFLNKLGVKDKMWLLE